MKIKNIYECGEFATRIFADYQEFSRMSKIRDEKELLELGMQIRNNRTERGMTMTELAFAADIEYSQVSKIELGKQDPSFCTLKSIANALGMKLKDLIHC